MSEAVKGAGPAGRPKPVQKPDPDGPVQPLDVPDIGDVQDVPIDLGKSEIRINGSEGVTVSTEIGGVPLDLNINNDGLAVESRPAQANPPPASQPASQPSER
jgi:penicillin-binding protein 1A